MSKTLVASRDITSIKLSIFDSGLLSNCNQNSILRIYETIKTAQKSERLGYSRYWIAEHHSRDVAWRSTDIVLTLIAGSTTKMRIGSAGVLLKYHNALLVAQNYKLLTNLFYERIDLGLAQGITSAEIHEALLDGKTPNPHDFHRKAKFIRDLFTQNQNNVFISPPYEGVFPELWILGTSLRNLDFAYSNGMNFSLSLCHMNQYREDSDEIKKIVKEARNRNYEQGFKPKFSIMVSIICSKDAKKAHEIASRRAHTNFALSYYGTPLGCYNFLMEINEQYNTSEIIICDLCKDIKERVISLSLISEVMQLVRLT